MADIALNTTRRGHRKVQQVSVWAFLVVGSIALLAAIALHEHRISLALLSFGAAILGFGLLVQIQRTHRLRKDALKSAILISAIEHDVSPCFLTDIDGQITFRNETAHERLPGMSVETLENAFADLFANPASILFRVQSKALAIGSAREDIVTRKGHVRLTANAIDDQTLIWRLEDLTDRGGGARAADALSLPMLTAGPTGTVLYMNEAFRRLMGGRAKSLDSVFNDLPLVSGQMHRVQAEQHEIESLVAVVPSHGGRREIYLLPGESYAQAVNVATEWDAIEELPTPLLKISGKGLVLSANLEARRLLDLPIEEGTRISDLLRGLGRPIVDWISEIVQGKGSSKPQFLDLNHPTKEVVIQVALHPAQDVENPHVIAVLSDVTEFKSLERQFVQSQKMQAIGQLAGGVAHDFNNLLTAISGHCDLLLLRHDQGDMDYSDLLQIHQNANRAAALVGQLLAFSRKQNLQPEVLDLRDTLAESTHLLNRLVGEKVSLILEHDPGLDPIRADKRQLEQVLMNLVVNARDAMSNGGEIRIETENVMLQEPLSRDRATVPAGKYVVLRVHDDGTGMSEDVSSKIFEPFWTTKKAGEGTGLGLSTAYGIIKQTGGFIFVDSEPGKGTSFSIFIPSYDAPLDIPAPAIATENPAPTTNSGVVLLVEDEAPVRAFASRALHLKGFTVLEADCADAALNILSDAELHVDLFLTDVVMPGMDGPTWVREALKQRPDTQVVFISGYAEETFDDDQQTIPNSVFLPKPFSLTELIRTVQMQLQSIG